MKIFSDSFMAVDNIDGKKHFSKDYKSLAEFFSFHDNIQYKIFLIEDEKVKLNWYDFLTTNGHFVTELLTIGTRLKVTWKQPEEFGGDEIDDMTVMYSGMRKVEVMSDNDGNTYGINNEMFINGRVRFESI